MGRPLCVCERERATKIVTNGLAFYLDCAFTFRNDIVGVYNVHPFSCSSDFQDIQQI